MLVCFFASFSCTIYGENIYSLTEFVTYLDSGLQLHNFCTTCKLLDLHLSVVIWQQAKIWLDVQLHQLSTFLHGIRSLCKESVVLARRGRHPVLSRQSRQACRADCANNLEQLSLHSRLKMSLLHRIPSLQLLSQWCKMSPFASTKSRIVVHVL